MMPERKWVANAALNKDDVAQISNAVKYQRLLLKQKHAQQAPKNMAPYNWNNGMRGQRSL